MRHEMKCAIIHFHIMIAILFSWRSVFHYVTVLPANICNIMLEQSQKFTSQNVNKKARRFDNYTVVFFSGMYNNRK